MGSRGDTPHLAREPFEVRHCAAENRTTCSVADDS
jgi:hypothetical protein